MSRARTLATVLGSDGTLGATEITTALGYTPLNPDSNNTISGLLTISRNGLNYAWVQRRYGKRTGTGTYILFTRGDSSAQSSGVVEVQAIYGTPSGAGVWRYIISGDRRISLIYSNTSIYSGSTPSVYWDGNDLKVDNSNSSVYYDVMVELHNIGIGWNAVWGNFPNMQ